MNIRKKRRWPDELSGFLIRISSKCPKYGQTHALERQISRVTLGERRKSDCVSRLCTHGEFEKSMVTSDNVARERATVPSALSGHPFWHSPSPPPSTLSTQLSTFSGMREGGRRGGESGEFWDGGRDMVADKQLLKNASGAWLPSAFFSSSSASSGTPFAKPTPGGGERIQDEWATRVPHAHSLFFVLASFLPSFLPSSLPSLFHPAQHRCPASSISQLATGELLTSRTLARAVPPVIYTCHGVCTTCRRHFLSLIADWKFENRVSPHRVVLINTSLIGRQRK